MTADDLAAMIDEAAWVARNLKGRTWPTGHRNYWPDIVHDQWDAYGWNAAESPRERPTARQIDLLDRVQQIVSSASAPLRKLLWDVAMIQHRSGATNWAAVARRHGVHPATAKRRWTGALLSVVSLLPQSGAASRRSG